MQAEWLGLAGPGWACGCSHAYLQGGVLLCLLQHTFIANRHCYVQGSTILSKCTPCRAGVCVRGGRPCACRLAGQSVGPLRVNMCAVMCGYEQGRGRRNSLGKKNTNHISSAYLDSYSHHNTMTPTLHPPQHHDPYPAPTTTPCPLPSPHLLYERRSPPAPPVSPVPAASHPQSWLAAADHQKSAVARQGIRGKT